MKKISLTEFLLARITEDEEAAQAVIPAGRPLEDGAARWSVVSVVSQTVGDASGYVVAYGVEGEYPRRHIARHDPARVLAECAAKRRIVELATRDLAEATWESDPIRRSFNAGAASCASNMVHILALPHADHADYDEDWKP